MSYCKEGWTISSLMNEINPEIKMIMSGESWIKPFADKKEVKEWIKSRLPNDGGAVMELTKNVCKTYNIK